MKVTLHEVAARAEVSIATVSRALNGLPVSEASLERVKQAALELGYVVNEAARSLRAERTMTMGLIFSDLSNTLGIDLLDALSEAIEQAGYSLIISTARGDEARYDVLMRRFLERRVDGLFCVRPRGGGESLTAYQASGIPVIAMFVAGGPFAELPLITPTFAAPAKALAEHLKSLGHAHVAVVRHGSRPSAAQHAIAETLRASGVSAELLEPPPAEGMTGLLAALMAREPRPSAIIAPDPDIRGLVAASAAAGLRVPEDLSLVAIGELGAEGYYRKRGLSSVTIDPQRMARTAGGAMLDCLRGAPVAERIKVQVADFTPRATTGPAASFQPA